MSGIPNAKLYKGDLALKEISPYSLTAVNSMKLSKKVPTWTIVKFCKLLQSKAVVHKL